MYEFSSTEEFIAFCFADFSIRSNAKGLILEELDGFESDRVAFVSHCFSPEARKAGRGRGGAGGMK